MALNPKQQRFVDEFLVDLNATKAAIRAGYSQKTAYSQGFDLLKKPEVQEALSKARAERAERVQVEADEVLRTLLTIARSDPTHYRVNETTGALELAPGAPPRAWQAVASVKHRIKTRTPEKGPVERDHVVEFRLWDKNTALQNLGRHLGMWIDKRELSAPGGKSLIPEGPSLRDMSHDELKAYMAQLIAEK